MGAGLEKTGKPGNGTFWTKKLGNEIFGLKKTPEINEKSFKIYSLKLYFLHFLFSYWKLGSMSDV